MCRTYFDNLCLKDVLSVKYKGRKLILSRAALNESMRYGLDLEDCKHILEDGYIGRKRSEGSEEKWLDAGKKTYNVVIIESFNHSLQERIYLIKHIGCFTRK